MEVVYHNKLSSYRFHQLNQYMKKGLGHKINLTLLILKQQLFNSIAYR